MELLGIVCVGHIHVIMDIFMNTQPTNKPTNQPTTRLLELLWASKKLFKFESTVSLK